MSNCILKLYIKSFKNQKTEVFPLILRVFERLINYYARRLENSDDSQELNLFFIELLFSIDVEKFATDNSNSLAKYIAVAIRNKYIEISKSNSDYKSHFLLFGEGYFTANTDLMLKLEMVEMLDFLSEKQRQVIIYKFFYGYSDAEISQLMGISRQAVNNLKNRALETLRHIYL